MSKNAQTRITEILQTVSDNNCNPGALRALINKGGLQFAQQCSNAASMGKHAPFMSQANLDRRALVRAIIFTRLLKRRLMSAQVAHARTTLSAKASVELARILRGEFDVNRDNSQQAAWGPHAFTDPTNHNDSNYRYIIHGLQGNAVKVYRDANTVTSRFDDWVKRYKTTPGTNYNAGGVGVDASIRIKMYQEYLRDPSLLRTDIISSSVVSHVANGTYTDFGFIMRVPAANVMLTSDRDLAYKNRRGDQRAEIERYAGQQMLTPTQVVQGMAGRALGKSLNEKNRVYSEIVVLGAYKPIVDDEIKAHLIQCSQQFNLPVVELPSPGGKRAP